MEMCNLPIKLKFLPIKAALKRKTITLDSKCKQELCSRLYALDVECHYRKYRKVSVTRRKFPTVNAHFYFFLMFSRLPGIVLVQNALLEY